MNWSPPFAQWVLLAFSIALTTFGGIGLASEVKELLRALASRHWPEVEAEMLTVSVEERRGARGRRQFEPVVRYRYFQGGRAREATRLAFGTLHLGSRIEAEQLVAPLQTGLRGLVRVRPEQPEMVVLTPGPNGFIWSRLAFFGVYTTCALIFLFQALQPFQR